MYIIYLLPLAVTNNIYSLPPTAINSHSFTLTGYHMYPSIQVVRNNFFDEEERKLTETDNCRRLLFLLLIYNNNRGNIRSL